MKIKTAFTLIFLLPLTTFAQLGTWAWLKGDSTGTRAGNFGTQGVAASANTPPGIYEPAEFTDLQGNFWLYGGLNSSYANYSDLWQYSVSTNQWTWVKGTGVTGDPGSYGTIGVPSITNRPPARGWGAASWVDLNGDFWLYGGSATGGGVYADMWRYNIATNTWTWMQGSSSFASPLYGTQGVASSTNTPGSRYECSATWVDNSGNLWLFGGYNGSSNLNDLWMYDISTNQWTWMKGSTGTGAPGVYGTMGVGAAANTPGARQAYCSWKDQNGKFWLFGGSLYGTGSYNDMWMYDPATNIWTWVSGSNFAGGTGNYGALCADSTIYSPSARFENRARCVDGCGNFWLFGGGEGSSFNSCFSDLWQFNPSNNKWKLVKGSATNYVPTVWGTRGIGSAANTPGGRAGAISWIDGAGNVYVFGGTVDGWISPFNDLWKFTPDPSCTFAGAAAASSFLGNDVSYCGAFSTVLNANNPSAIWSTGDTAAQITVTSPGTFWASFNQCGATVTDTIVISQTASLSFNLGPDTSICRGQPLHYTIPVPNASYLWSTGDTTNAITTTSAGTLWARVSQGGCVATDTVHITLGGNVVPPFNLGNDTAYCGLFTRVLSTGNPATVWSTGVTAAQITISTPGLYWAKDSTGCGIVSDTIVVTSHNPQVSIAPTSSTICSSDSVQLCATAGFSAYHWNNGAVTNCIYESSAGNYYVTVTDGNNCTVESNHVSVSVYPNPPVLISRNGDTLKVYNGLTYQWYLDGALLPGDTLPMLIATKKGSYTVLITDSNGCAAISTAVIFDGIEYLMDDKIVVYPNPLQQGNWFVNIGSSLIGTPVEIFDDNGRLVYRAELTRLENELNLDVARGVYFLKLNINHSVWVYKLVRL